MKTLLVTLLLTTFQALAAPPPNQTDLQAAYCSAVVKKKVESSTNFFSDQSKIAQLSPDEREMFQQMANSEQAMQRRILRYLLPRTEHVDSQGLITAAQQGEEDYAASRLEWQQCVQRCSYGQKDCFNACVAAMNTSRVARCNSGDYLPY